MGAREIVTLELRGDARNLTNTLTGSETKVRAWGSSVAQGIGALGPVLLSTGALFTSMSTEMNEGLSEVSTLIPGQTDRLLELKSAVQDLAVDYGTPTSGLVGGLYEGISAFGDTADTVKILEINTKAAKAGVASVSESIALTSAVTKGYGEVNADTVAKVADLAFKTVELGQTNFPQLAASIGKVVPLASSLKVSQEELFGVMATATGVTGGAAEVSTQLRGVLQGLMAPTADMSKLYGSMGVESGKALIEQEGLHGALNLIVDAAEASGQPLTKYIGSIEGVTLAQTLTSGAADAWVEKTAAMGAAAGSVDVAFGEMTEGVNASSFALDQYKQRFVVWGQQAGQAITDFSGPLATGLLGLAQFGGALSMMGPQITTLMVTMGGWQGVMAAVGTAGRVMWAGLTGPIGLTLAGIAALGAAWVLWGDEIKAFLAGAWNSFVGVIEGAIDWLRPVATLIGVDLPDGLDSWKISTEEVTTATGDTKTAVEQYTGAIEDQAEATKAAEEPARDMRDLLGADEDSVKAAAKAAEDALKDLQTQEAKIGENGNAALVNFRQDLLGFTASLPADVLAPPPLPIEVMQAHETRMGEMGEGGSAAFAVAINNAMAGIPADQLRPPDLVLDNSGDQAGLAIADSFFSTFSRAFEGGGGFMGGLRSAMNQGFQALFAGGGGGGGGGGGFFSSLAGMFRGGGEASAAGFVGPPAPGGGGLLSGIGGRLASGVGWLQKGMKSVMNFVPIVGPLIAQFGPALLGGIKKLGGAIWGGIKQLFGGPSGAELGRRETYHGFREQAEQDLAGVKSYQDAVNAEMEAGQNRNVAHAKQAFGYYAEQAGKTWHEGLLLHDRFLRAVGAGNQSTMDAILATVTSWRDESTVKVDEMEQNFDEFFTGVTAEKAPALTAAMATAFEETAAAGGVFAEEMTGIFATVGGAADAYIGTLASIPRNITTTVTVNRVFSGDPFAPFIPGRQHGGPVEAGRPYIVGERGAELFVPSRPGAVLPGAAAAAPIEIRLVNQLDRRVLSERLIRVEERTRDFYGI